MARVDDSDDAVLALARIDLNLLVHLNVLLQEKSVTRAAGRIGLTQPAMSHSLSRCRRLMGDDLLTRVGGALEHTPRGRDLLAPLSRLLREISVEVLDRPAFDPRTSRRRFRIACTSTTAVVMLPPLLKCLKRLSSPVTVQSVPLPEHTDLTDEPDIDLILLPDLIGSSLSRERLYNDRWVVVVRGDTLGHDKLSVADLSRIPHVVFETLDGRRIQPYSVMDALGVDRHVLVRTDDFLTLPQLAADTPTLAVTQLRIARKYARTRLRVLPLPIDVPPLGIDMVWNPRLHEDPAKDWLRGQLIAAVPDDNLLL